MRATILCLPLFAVAPLVACDAQFSSPGGHPVPLDAQDTTGGDTGGGPVLDTRLPPADTTPSADGAVPKRIDGWSSGGSGACDPSYFACTPQDDLEYCDGAAIAVADCAAVCRDAGYAYSTGCGYDESYQGDVCWCDNDNGPSGPPSPPPDVPPPTTCPVGWSCEGDTLSYCDGHAVESWSCDDFCRGEGYAYASACGYDSSVGGDACLCEDDACTSGADVCLGQDYLETCGASGTVTVDCWDVCHDAGYDRVSGCGYDASYGGDSCFCENEVCAANELTCADGSCLDTRYVCDGVSDCSTGDDEWNCPATCVEGDSWCVTGNELEVCDGGEQWTYDCDDFCRSEGFDYSAGCGYDDASDADACYCAYEACASWEFQCADGLCLDAAYTCDGYLDCAGGEDELGCQ